MKKIISVLLTLVLCFSSVCAFAAPSIDDVFNASYTDYEATAEISFTLDKPLEILDVLSEFIDYEMDNDGILFSDIVDLRALVESIFDATQTMNLKCDISKDYKKVNIYLSQSSNAPIVINKNLTVTADTKSEVWIKLDFSNAENPVYQIIASAPASDKYMVMDYGELYNDIEAIDTLNTLSALFDEEVVNKINKLSLTTLKENADISYKGGYLIVKMNDSQAKSWLIDTVYQALEMAQIPDVEFTDEQVNQIKLILEGVKIFGENGIEMKYKTNSKGIISAAETKISIDINLYDILTLAGISDFEGITKDNSNIAFTINEKDTYSKVNKGEKVKFPTLTEENTINLLDYTKPDYGYNEEEEYIWPWEYVYFTTPYPIIENGTPYIPLREFMSALTAEDAYISWDNGKTTITSATKFFNTISFDEGSNIVIKDGNEIILDEPIKTINGRTALSYEFIEKVFKCDYFHISYYNAGEWSYGIDVANPDYKE